MGATSCSSCADENFVSCERAALHRAAWRTDIPSSGPASCPFVPARFAWGSLPEHAALQVLVAGLGTEPDGEERPGEVVAGYGSPDVAVHRDLESGAGPPGERHRVALLHVGDERRELGDRRLRALIPDLAQRRGPARGQVAAVDVTQELHRDP